MKMHILDAAEQVLKEAGEPLHYGEITRRMARKGLWTSTGKTPDATVQARLSSDLKFHREKSRFVRPQRGVFGLRSAGRSVVAAKPAGLSAKRAKARSKNEVRGLARLERTLEKVTRRDHLGAMVNESKTRSYMVDKVLESLGWGPRTLEHELSTGPKGRDKVDIALRPGGPHDEIEVMVEVKSASLDTSDEHVMQLLRYCRLEDVKLGLLTNGRTWKFYYGMHTKQRDYFAEEIDITKGDARTAACRLDQFLSLGNVKSGKAEKFIKEAWGRRRSLPEWTRLLQRRWNALLPELTNIVAKDLKESGNKEVPRDVIEAFIRERVNLQEVSDFAVAPASQPGSASAPVLTKGKPAHIELFGERRPFRGWRTSLREFLSEVHNRNPDSLRKLMEHRPRSFVQNPEKGRFRVPFNIGGSNVLVETHMSADGIQKLIRDVCRHLGLPESVFRPIY